MQGEDNCDVYTDELSGYSTKRCISLRPGVEPAAQRCTNARRVEEPTREGLLMSIPGEKARYQKGVNKDLDLRFEKFLKKRL